MLTSIPLTKSFKREETRDLYFYLLMSYAYLCGDFPLPDLIHKNYNEYLEVYNDNDNDNDILFHPIIQRRYTLYMNFTFNFTVESQKMYINLF